MKLSDSMTLGSTIVTAKPKVLYDDNGFGCALGMAAVAVGATWREKTPEEKADPDQRTHGIERLWPWLMHSLQYPCKCFSHRSSSSDRGKTVISHIFDHHVFGLQDWSMEKLLAFVQKIEPQIIEISPADIDADGIRAVHGRE